MPVVTLRPDRFAAGGEAIARDDGGRVVFVRGALPGEIVDAEVTTEKKDWARALTVVDVERGLAATGSTPPCPSRRAGCGGCGWQHLTVDAQRRRPGRHRRRRPAPHRAASPTPLVELGRRRRPGRATARRSAWPPTADGARRLPRRAAPTTSSPRPTCLVAHPALRRAARRRSSLDPDVEPTLRVSVATGELAARWDEVAGERPRPARAVRGSVRRAALHEDVAGHRLRVSMGSFFQSGPQAAELLVDTVRRAAPELAQRRPRRRRLRRHRHVRRLPRPTR